MIPNEFHFLCKNILIELYLGQKQLSEREFISLSQKIVSKFSKEEKQKILEYNIY